MIKTKFADWTGQEKEKVFIYWKSITEIADSIFKWVNATGRIGSIETVVNIAEDEEQKNESFYGLPLEIIIKALYQL
jgi:hypothetical protein